MHARPKYELLIFIDFRLISKWTDYISIFLNLLSLNCYHNGIFYITEIIRSPLRCITVAYSQKILQTISPFLRNDVRAVVTCIYF